MNEDLIYIGTKLKYILEITCDGFSMDDNEFCVDLYRGPNTLHLDKADLEHGIDGNWYVCFDTNVLGAGVVTAKVTALVPDLDFHDGIRVEVEKYPLVTIIS